MLKWFQKNKSPKSAKITITTLDEFYHHLDLLINQYNIDGSVAIGILEELATQEVQDAFIQQFKEFVHNK